MINIDNSSEFLFGSKQQGIVLFFALIALVVMSLAAVALIRGTDTNSMIAGNLAFKRSAVASADSGSESGLNWMLSQSAVALQSNNAAKAYFATSVDDPATTDIDESDGKALVEDSGIAASGVGIDSDGKDSNSNTTTYVIQRMCRTTGEATAANCVLGPGAKPGCLDNNGIPLPESVCASIRSPIYRVTSKVVGPKNTVSYIQAFMI